MTPLATNGRVLVVCTGNVCRSPYVERLLRRDLDPVGISVGSAGTGALDDRPMDPSALELLRAQGVDGRDFRATQLTAGLVRGADLVVCAAREHVDEVARLHPRALRYTFALRDLGDLLRDVTRAELLAESGNAVERVARAALGRRGRVQPRRPEDASVVDPYRQARKVFDEMSEQVAEALPPLVTSLQQASSA